MSRPRPRPRGLGKPPPPMTREDRRVLDEQRRALDGIGGQVRSSVPTQAYRERFDAVDFSDAPWRKRA